MIQKCSQFLETLDDYLNHYIIDQKGFSLNTQRSYKHTFQLLIEFFYTVQRKSSGDLQFTDLTYENLSAFLGWLETTRNCSISTRNQRLAALKSFSIFAQIKSIDAATVFRCAVLKITNKKSIPNEKSFFSLNEVKYLLESVEDSAIGHRNKALFSFMYASGARAQEACDIKVKDIVFAENKATVILHGKGNKSRRITIPDKPAKIMLNYLRETKKYGKTDEYIFSSQTHYHMTISCIEEIYKKYISIAKENHPECFNGKYSPHSMRHTTATHMVEAGVSLFVIKNFLGHSSIETTQVYAKITEQCFNSNVSKWSAQWLKPEEITSKPNNCPDFLR